jgi:SAM-dependent methyltransferase
MTSAPDAQSRVESYDGLELASDPLDRVRERDFVGIGPGSRTLARLTIRRPVEAALDLGTGAGIQALLTARHARRVVGVDVSERALEFARANALRNGIKNVEWRLGSWFEPVRGKRFDLVLGNPPYVISPENNRIYRDSGEPGDALVRRLLGQLPDVLSEGGFAQLLCNWAVGLDGDWRSPVETAFAGRGCDGVILRFDVLDPAQYAESWNRDLEGRDGSAFRAVVDRWCTHYRELGIGSIAYGMVVLRQRTGRNWIRAFVVPAAPTEGAGEHLLRLFTGWDWVREGGGGADRPAPGAKLVRRVSLEDGSERITLEAKPNVGFAVRVDAAVADALLRGEPLSPEESKRLVGLGLLTPA